MRPKEYSDEVDLKKYWLILKRRWFPASGVFGVTVVIAALLTAMQESTYTANAKLLFESDKATILTGLESQLGRGELAGLTPQSDPLVTQAEIIKSLPVAQATIESLDLRGEDGEYIAPQSLAGELDVKPVPGTDVLQISYSANDPELAAAVVNQVMEEYKETNILMNRAEAAAAREFIVEQLPTSEQAVSEAEGKLRDFKEANGIIVLEEEATAAVTQLAGLDQEITQVQAELAQVSARTAELRGKVGMGARESIEMGALSQSVGVQEALLQLQEVQGELATQRGLYRDNHPAVAQLLRQEQEATELLQSRVSQILGRDESVTIGNLQMGELEQGLVSDFVQTEIERIGLVRRLNQLANSQNIIQQRKSVMPELEKTQRELERQLAAAQTTYETLLNRLEEIQVAENQVVGNAQVVSEALVPTGPVAPNKKLNLAAGILAGLLLAIAVAFLTDLFDQSVKTVQEAKNLFGQAILGIVPAFGKASPKRLKNAGEYLSSDRLVVKAAPHSPVGAAYQMLQANLKFVKTDGPLKSIIVTSAVHKEGKTEVAANLAVAIAQVGRRVLLVDANFRHPAQHHIWDLNNVIGLSNIIVGQTSFEEAVEHPMTNLDVLLAGAIPPNPIALLDSKRMAELIDKLVHHYDMVIFDTPALAGAGDAPSLSKMVDGTLLVVRPGVVNAVQARNARDFLSRSKLNVLGLVANGVMVTSEPDSYFYYQQEPAAVGNPVVERQPAAKSQR
jgi:capsular exopolysaccharide synthesis family protein